MQRRRQDQRSTREPAPRPRQVDGITTDSVDFDIDIDPEPCNLVYSRLCRVYVVSKTILNRRRTESGPHSGEDFRFLLSLWRFLPIL